MVKSLERYILGKGEYRWVYDNKPTRLSHSIRYVFSIISLIVFLIPVVYFFNILSGNLKFEIFSFSLYLFLGTTKANHIKAPNPFIIIGTFYPKKDLQSTLKI